MKLINNSESVNHYSVMMDLSKDADTMIIASPFCYSDFRPFANDLRKNASVRSVTFITTLKNDEVISKTDALLSFSAEMDKNGIEHQMYIDNSLHGKVYILKKGNNYVGAIVTSANLTGNGQIKNHEWGCLLEDKNTIQKLEDKILGDAKNSKLSIENLNEIKERVDAYIRDNGFVETPPVPRIDIDDILSQLALPSGVNFFIKPIGSADFPVINGDYSLETEQFFSRKRPNSVRTGDILISYGVGSRKIVSAFRVLSGPYNTGKQDDRWPWYFEVENLTPDFGRIWYKKNLYITDLVNQYVSTYNAPVTMNGGYTFNGLKFGLDKIRLTEAFGRYLFQKVLDENKRI